MDHSEHSPNSESGLTDKEYAHVYWYGVAAFTGILVAVRIINKVQVKQRLHLIQKQPDGVPSKTHGLLSTTTAIAREVLYPQPVHFTGRLSKYFSPLPLGRWLLLIVYWTVLLSFLWTGTIISPDDPMYAYRWEKVGFRAAWISVTQVPLVYLLSCKLNPITLLTGISYERFNWLHRWAARTLFLTVVVHWSFFYHSWSIYDIVTAQMNFMPMVRFGFAAWGVLTWMILSGFGFFRALSYEFFVAQHIAGAGVMLWLLFVHVPSDARYNIYIAMAFLAFDWGGRTVHVLLRNTHILKRKVPGYSAWLELLPGDVTRVTIEDVDFSWTAGQHIYINIPSLRPFETHPFTISNAPASPNGNYTSSMSILIQARSGFSRSVYNAAVKGQGASHHRRRLLISGPWGSPPRLSHYETVVLIACSSGASFIVPLLQDVVRRRGCVRNVELHWIVRTEDHFNWFEDELQLLVEQSNESELKPQIRIHITRQQEAASSIRIGTRPKEGAVATAAESSQERASISSVLSIENDKSPLTPPPRRARRSEFSTLRLSYGRPTVESLIRPAVENAFGETAVVVCGGLSITAESRTCVANLSDERAVHKGTGAQGIYLFTETYGW